MPARRSADEYMQAMKDISQPVAHTFATRRPTRGTLGSLASTDVDMLGSFVLFDDDKINEMMGQPVDKTTRDVKGAHSQHLMGCLGEFLKMILRCTKFSGGELWNDVGGTWNRVACESAAPGLKR